MRRSNGRVSVEVSDDGVGGADAARGSGLRGLADRVAALDGTLSLDSPAGRGTRVHAEIPVHERLAARPRPARGPAQPLARRAADTVCATNQLTPCTKPGTVCVANQLEEA